MADDLLIGDPASRSSLAAWIVRARTELEAAVSFDHVKAVRDQTAALRGYAKSIGAAQTALNAIAEIKIRAERLMGRELAGLDLHPGGRPQKTGDAASPVSTPTLAALGIHKKWSQRWQALARIPLGTFETCIIDARRNGEELTTAGLCRAAAAALRSESAAAAQAEPAAGAADAVERQLEALERAWAAADDAARRLFMEKHRPERRAPHPVVRLAASNTGFSAS